MEDLEKQIIKELRMYRYPNDMIIYAVSRTKKLMKDKNLNYKEAVAYHVAKERELLK